MKSDPNGCHTVYDFARRSLKFRFFTHSGESEGVGRRVGKLTGIHDLDPYFLIRVTIFFPGMNKFLLDSRARENLMRARIG